MSQTENEIVKHFEHALKDPADPAKAGLQSLQTEYATCLKNAPDSCNESFKRVMADLNQKGLLSGPIELWGETAFQKNTITRADLDAKAKLDYSWSWWLPQVKPAAGANQFDQFAARELIDDLYNQSAAFIQSDSVSSNELPELVDAFNSPLIYRSIFSDFVKKRMNLNPQTQDIQSAPATTEMTFPVTEQSIIDDYNRAMASSRVPSQAGLDVLHNSYEQLLKQSPSTCNSTFDRVIKTLGDNNGLLGPLSTWGLQNLAGHSVSYDQLSARAKIDLSESSFGVDQFDQFAAHELINEGYSVMDKDTKLTPVILLNSAIDSNREPIEKEAIADLNTNGPNGKLWKILEKFDGKPKITAVDLQTAASEENKLDLSLEQLAAAKNVLQSWKQLKDLKGYDVTEKYTPLNPLRGPFYDYNPLNHLLPWNQSYSYVPEDWITQEGIAALTKGKYHLDD